MDTCKDCGKVFYMSKSEVDFFAKKELMLPKRCSACRDKKKGIVKVVPKVTSKQTTAQQPVKSAMAIAMKKAGITSVEKYLEELNQ